MTATDQVIGTDCEFNTGVTKVAPGQVARITLRPRTNIRVTEVRIQNSGRWEVRAMRIGNREVPLPRHANVHEVFPWHDYVMEVAYVGLDQHGEVFHAWLIGARVEEEST